MLAGSRGWRLYVVTSSSSRVSRSCSSVAVAEIWRSVGLGWLSSSVLQYRSYSDEGSDSRVPPSPEASSAAVDTHLSGEFPPAGPKIETFGADRPIYGRNSYPARRYERFRVQQTVNAPIYGRNSYPAWRYEGFRVQQTVNAVLGLDRHVPPSPEASSAARPLVDTPLSREFAAALPKTQTFGSDRPVYDRNAYPPRKREGFRVGVPVPILKHEFTRTALNEEKRTVGNCLRASSIVAQESCHDSLRQGFVNGRELPIGSAGGGGNKHLTEEIAILERRQQQGICIDSHTFVQVLKLCSKQKDLVATRRVNECIIQSGMDRHPFVANTLLNAYVKCGRLQDARRVFDGLEKKDDYTWSIMIGGYAKNDNAEDALEVLNQMRQGGARPDELSCMSILNACASPLALKWGKEVHAYIRHAGLESDVRVGTSLVQMYAQCGRITAARRVFGKMTNRDVITWNAMIGAYAKSGFGVEAYRIFLQMQREGFVPNAITYLSILNASASERALEWVKAVHSHALKAGLAFDFRVGNALVHMYAKSGSMGDARLMFDRLKGRDVRTWTTMIGAYAESGCGVEAYRLFHQMQREGFKPDGYTYASILKASASAEALEWGKEVHGHARRAGLESDLIVGGALVHMYAKSGNIGDARVVFDKLKTRDVITWTVMIGAYAESGCGVEAYQLFLQMKREGFIPDAITYMSILNASASAGALEWVKEVHSHARRAGLESDLRVGAALVHMYAKSGSIADARVVFDRLKTRDVRTWTIMIGAYAESGCGVEAYRLFLQMKQEGFIPDAYTCASILNASASVGALEWVKEVHRHALEGGLESDLRVGNALVHMYAKCGNIDDALLVFNRLEKRNVFTWTAMIGGFAQHGRGHEALEFLRRMNGDGVKPNETSFAAVLSACCHAGLVDDGRRLLLAMTHDYGIEPTVVHYTCMVDLLGRAGHLEEAKHFIDDMPVEPNAVTWKALLGACRTHGNVELGELAANEALKLEPKDGAAYVALSNIYAAAGKWEKVQSVRTMMQKRGVRKEPGRSWIEVDSKIHEFVVGDTCHPEAKAIYTMLEKLTEKLKSEGYIPDTKLVLHDIHEEDKELALCSHSEKLAIAYGLLRIPRGKPIRVYKNLRVCSDCHTATKFISKVTGREIIARDANRFHHFKDGVCSCGDYW